MCFVTNVFPEHMDSQVARVQPEGVLHKQSVPPLLPAYNKFMGGVDRTGHIRKHMGLIGNRSAFGFFFQFFNYAIDNSYVLYKHDCKRCKTRPKDLLGFRLELVHQLLENVGVRMGVRSGTCSASVDSAQSESVLLGESA